MDFLLAAHQRHARPPHAASDSAAAAPLHVLELAAGPARHCLAALQVEHRSVLVALCFEYLDLG